MKIPKEDKKISISNEEDEGKSWPQILAIAVGCLSALNCGLLFSWSSPSILKITKDREIYDINEEEASYFTVIPPIAMIISSLAFSELNDKIGRKKTLLLIAIPHIISWVLIAFATSVYVFYISRFFTGMGDACLFASMPMYLGEISTPKVRGSWGNAFTFAIYFGQFLINAIGSYLSIRETAYICVIIPIIFVVTFSFMPESPYFFVMKGNEDEARKSLQRLRRKENVEKELISLKADVHRQMSESGTWKDLLMIKSNRKAVLSGIFLRASQQLGGISTFAVYAQFIFDKSGGNLSPQISSIIFSCLACLLNLCAAFTLDKIGRKNSYLYSLILCSVVLFAEAIYFYIDQNETDIDVTFLNWIPITGMVLFCIFYSFGVGIVPTLMLGELFSTSVKGKALCLMNIVFGILVSTVTKLFQVLEANVGLYCPFVFFSVCCLISTILSLYLVPETKGKTLEEIQQSLKSSKPKKNAAI